MVLSNPQQEDNTFFYEAKKAIEEVIEKNRLDIQLEIRDYCYYERFFNTYANKYRLIKHFGLGGHTK